MLASIKCVTDPEDSEEIIHREMLTFPNATVTDQEGSETATGRSQLFPKSGRLNNEYRALTQQLLVL
jgi:hypothetical protein